jgi:hypothetical protein
VNHIRSDTGIPAQPNFQTCSQSFVAKYEGGERRIEADQGIEFSDDLEGV